MMMAILNDFSSLPFFYAPPNPNALLFTFVLMLGVCVCDVGFSNTQQWIMALKHPEAMGLEAHQPSTPPTQAVETLNPNEEFCGFGQPYSWSTQDTMEASPLNNPIPTTNKRMSNQEVEDQFFVGGLFFGVPKQPVSSTEDGSSNSA
jgi:hypothetical protein